jgi:Methyltransferase domain
MNRFWDPVLRDVVQAARARRLVEVGVATGLLTEKLLDYCAASDAVLHAIDPEPQIDLDEWRERHGNRLVFHRARSLDVLADIHDIDVVMIDGDHNWYTVYHELKQIEKTALSDGLMPPLIAMHDVDWPYGRRDLYYDPDSIPEAHRQPYSRLGLVPGEAEPIEGGINWDLHNAIPEQSPHNGVRTAIEDFVSQSQLEWRLFFLHGFNGLGLGVTRNRLDDNESLRSAIESVQTAGFLDKWTQELELARIGAEVDANRTIVDAREAIERRLKSGIEDRLAQTDRLQQALVDAERRLAGVPDLELRIAELERQLAEARRDAEVARAEAGALDERLTFGEQVLADVFNSPSWRVTQPLRRAKHSVARLRQGLGQ